MKLKLMTYNVFSGRNAKAQLDLQGIAEVIRAEAPDICVLNEVRVNDPTSGNCDHAAFYAQAAGMDYHFARAIYLKEGEYGIALLSRLPILKFEVFPVPSVPEGERERCFEDRVIERAEIDTGRGVIAVYGSHFGLSNAEQLNAERLLMSLLDAEKLPRVFMGDLNLTPDSDIIKRISLRLADTDPAHAPTFPSPAPDRTIDYIFTGEGFGTVESRIIPVQASDHLPRVTVVEI